MKNLQRAQAAEEFRDLLEADSVDNPLDVFLLELIRTSRLDRRIIGWPVSEAT